MSAAETLSDVVIRRRERWRRISWMRKHPGEGSVPPRKRPWRRWEPEDDETMIWQWGLGQAFSIPKLAKLLGRTPEAVKFHAHQLGLKATHEGTLTLAELCDEAGYHPQTIKRAAAHLGIKLEACVATTAYRRSRPGRYAIERETADAILAWLREQGHVNPFRLHGKEWGTLGKPDACLLCGGTEREHGGRGLCRACYQRVARRGGLADYPVIRKIGAKYEFR